MAFPVLLASKMSGASIGQLAYWRSSGVLKPELESSKPPLLYSFRDIVALRTVAWLRSDHSLQSVRKALATLPELDLAEHPAKYKLVKLGKSIGVVADDDPTRAIDLVKEPGQITLGTLQDVFAEFETHGHRRVDSLIHPREGVEVNPAKLGGWPTIVGTRVPYDVVAALIGDGTISPNDVVLYYPGVSAQAARDALDYHQSIMGKAA